MILVTGASGLLGSYICRELQALNVDFRALVRQGGRLDLLKDIPEGRLVYGDLLDTWSLEEALKDVDSIIHSAAIMSFNKKEQDMMHRVNVEGTRSLINLALKKNIEYFVHISSVAALGRQNRSGVINEDSQWTSSRWNTGYGESKHLAELEVWRGMQENLNAVIINPSLILGPGDWDHSSARLFKYIWDEKRYYTEGWLNYVDVRDVSGIIRELIEKRIKGERFIVSAGTMSYKDLFDKIAVKLNKRSPYKKVTAFTLKLAVAAERIKSLFTGKMPLITSESAKVSQNQISYDNAKILKKLNFKFARVEDTLEWTCREFLRQHRHPK